MSAAVPQHIQALANANLIRLEGSRIRRLMGEQPSDDSRRRAAELLRDPPDAIAHMRVGHFLSGIQRFGRGRATRHIRQAGLTPGVWDRRIGPLAKDTDTNGRLTLTARQRAALAAALTEKYE